MSFRISQRPSDHCTVLLGAADCLSWFAELGENDVRFLFRDLVQKAWLRVLTKPPGELRENRALQQRLTAGELGPQSADHSLPGRNRDSQLRCERPRLPPPTVRLNPQTSVTPLKVFNSSPRPFAHCARFVGS